MLRYAGEQLGQHPQADAGVASGKAEQLPGPPSHVFRGRTVVKDNESAGAFETHTYHFQPKSNPVLLADDNKKISGLSQQSGRGSCYK